MGGRGNSGVRNTAAEERFEYKRSADLKEWSASEEKRTAEMSKYISDKIRTGDSFQEFYEENAVEELDSVTIPGDSNFREEEVSITKMNLVYAQNWDEEDRRVKQGKAVTGSTYYVVQTDNGSIDESNFAYKTKADAEHAMKLYVDEERQRRAYWARKKQ